MSGVFTQATLEQVRAASDIVDVIGASLPLKRAGANFVALCPFHREKSPSFHVNPQRQIFHCFGCHKGGDVFTFIKEYESLSFPEAVQRLAERARIPLELEKGGRDGVSRDLKDTLLQIHEQLTQRWQNALANDAAGQIARDYLAKRGVSAEAVQLFRLGYASDLWDDTLNWSKGKDYDVAVMEKAGLIIRKEGTDRFYDRFRGRLMFPICDEQARVIGFSGRVLQGDEKTAKYVNSPETPIFVKSKVFFGLDKSKRALLDAQCAVICEGQLDLIACFMGGVQNIVAPQGTAFTADHARILKRYVNEVVLCFDSDEAGQNAAVRSLDHMLAVDLAVRVAVIPAPHDPDSLIKAEGGAAFQELISKAEGFFDYYLKRLCSLHDVTADKGRLSVLRSMAEAVNKTSNAVLIDKYSQKTALRLGVTPEAVRREFRKLARSGFRNEAQTEELPPEPATESPPPPHELWLLKLLLLNPASAEWAAAHLDPSWVQHPLVRTAVTKYLHSEWGKGNQVLGSLLDTCEGPILRSLITEAATEERPIPNPERQLADIALRLRNQSIDVHLASLMQRLVDPSLADEAKTELLQEQQVLRASKRQPLAQLQHTEA